VHKPSSSGPKSPPPVLYSPKRVKLKVQKQRMRSETNGSEIELICKDESDDDRQPKEETIIKGTGYTGWTVLT